MQISAEKSQESRADGSFLREDIMAGVLYLVATPIGNLSDMTYRAVETLKKADLIACEDTRTSRPLLDHYQIQTPTTSYHKFNETEKGSQLLSFLIEGKNIAVITDAGSPGISDPGEVLTALCYENGIEVCAIPGPAAAVAAVTSSGQPCRRFVFEAFLPREKKERRRICNELAKEERTMIIYEAPHRLKDTLGMLSSVLGEDRPVTLCRELTKQYEEKEKTTLGEAFIKYQTKKPRGEFVLVIAGKSRQQAKEEDRARFESVDIEEHVQHYIDDGMDKMEAIKAAAKDRGIGKREVYRMLLDKQNDGDYNT